MSLYLWIKLKEPFDGRLSLPVPIFLRNTFPCPFDGCERGRVKLPFPTRHITLAVILLFSKNIDYYRISFFSLSSIGNSINSTTSTFPKSLNKGFRIIFDSRPTIVDGTLKANLFRSFANSVKTSVVLEEYGY